MKTFVAISNSHKGSGQPKLGPKPWPLFVRRTACTSLVSVSSGASRALPVELVAVLIDGSLARLEDGARHPEAVRRKMSKSPKKFHTRQIGCWALARRLPIGRRVPCELVYRLKNGSIAAAGEKAAIPGLEFKLLPETP